ncbi:unnamed protein product [Durusdinium trenchii]|uniref:C3H1-type domain-containing protein n=1 Tax=Durusdinium trenchii TaxID=1381693 RepID=A0ABP0JDP2_9DINO
MTMSKSEELGDLNHLVVAQLNKTKLCAMFARGSCNDTSCRFAHSVTELRAPPDLTKTAMCRAFARGECGDADCKFAHGEKELRVTESVYKTQFLLLFPSLRPHVVDPESVLAGSQDLVGASGCFSGPRSRCGRAHFRTWRSLFRGRRSTLRGGGLRHVVISRQARYWGNLEVGGERLCNFFMRGHCKKGNRCRHAHGAKELRSFKAEGASFQGAPKPLSPGRVHQRQGSGKQIGETTTFGVLVGGEPFDFPERQILEIFEDNFPSSPQTPCQWPADLLNFDGECSPSAFEVPMKVPLPRRPHTGIDGFDTPPRSLVPTPPLANYSPLASSGDLKHALPWNEASLHQQQIDCDPAGLAALAAAANMATVHAWTLASAAMKANYTQDVPGLCQVPALNSDQDLVTSMPMPRFADERMVRRYT